MTQLMAMGRSWAGKPLFAPRSEAEAVRSLRDALSRRIAGIKKAQGPLTNRITFRGEARRRVKDPGDPKQVGWTYLYNAKDPSIDRYKEILAPLARHRAMDEEAGPLAFHGEPVDEWSSWLTDEYQGRVTEGREPPQFILIVGGPDQVPFAFQAFLHNVASVGRVAPPADDLDQLQRYVDKLVRLEDEAAGPVVDREVLFFATDEGVNDPTYFSREYMVKPLDEHVRVDLKYATHVIEGEKATKGNLAAALAARKPALVYTASHGLGAADQTLEIQEKYNGAICCHAKGAGTAADLFSADDVPSDGVFLEGAVFFQFACYGYGTPAQSDYLHWLEGFPDNNSTRDFVAALPRKLLAHPRGPIAYIGHVDTAFLHGFTDAENPHLGDRWHKRIAPFKAAIDGILDAIEPSGLAMESMSERYAAANAVLTNLYDTAQRQAGAWSPDKSARFLDNWILRGDAQNFMVMGDPAALLRIPDGAP